MRRRGNKRADLQSFTALSAPREGLAGLLFISLNICADRTLGTDGTGVIILLQRHLLCAWHRSPAGHYAVPESAGKEPDFVQFETLRDRLNGVYPALSLPSVTPSGTLQERSRNGMALFGSSRRTGRAGTRWRVRLLAMRTQTSVWKGVRIPFRQFPGGGICLLGYRQLHVLVVNDVAVYACSCDLNGVCAHCGVDLRVPAAPVE
jgi:hypothetical protein